jgi:hypothetical protein
MIPGHLSNRAPAFASVTRASWWGGGIPQTDPGSLDRSAGLAMWLSSRFGSVRPIPDAWPRYQSTRYRRERQESRGISPFVVAPGRIAVIRPGLSAHVDSNVA